MLITENTYIYVVAPDELMEVVECLKYDNLNKFIVNVYSLKNFRTKSGSLKEFGLNLSLETYFLLLYNISKISTHIIKMRNSI